MNMPIVKTGPVTVRETLRRGRWVSLYRFAFDRLHLTLVEAVLSDMTNDLKSKAIRSPVIIVDDESFANQISQRYRQRDAWFSRMDRNCKYDIKTKRWCLVGGNNGDK